MMRIQTLGGLGVFDGARPLGGNTQQPRRLAILAVLARAGDRGVSRDRLAALLWEDVEEERARRNLNQALYALRRDLGSEEAILGTRELRLNGELIEVDLATFQDARAAGVFEEAARLYAGPFLGDFHLPGVPAFARWAEEERERLAADYRDILEAAAASAAKRDDRGAAVHWWRRLAALDPSDSRAAQGVMRALAAAGDAPGALRHAEVFEQIRKQELGLPRDPEVQGLAERIRQGELAPKRPAEVKAAPVEAGAPPGLKETPRPEGGQASETIPHAGRWPRVGPLVLVAALALGALLTWRSSHPTGSSIPPVKRLAVLPFENLGDSADTYFADGMTDELRGKLTTIPGIEVIASLSSNAYRGTARPLADIARDLQVGYLLIGKITWQKGEGGSSRVRVSPELVRIAPGKAPTTRWQQPFDAALTDVFQVQADIATRVAAALDVVLGDSARRELRLQPTENLAAYDEYLKGEAAAQAMKGDQANLRRAVAYYERAVQLDSSFAQAWSQLSRARTSLYSNGVPDTTLVRLARVAAERARELRPNDPLTYLALGDYYGNVNPVDNERALAEYERGLLLAPDHVDLLSAAVMTETSMGRWEGVTAHLDRAAQLDPRSATAARRQATVNLFLRHYDAADSAADRAVSLAPTNPAIASLKVLVAVARGDTSRMRAVIRAAVARIDPVTVCAFLAYYQDLYWALDDRQQLQVLQLPVSAFDGDRGGWAMVRAQLYHLRGDRRRTLIYADSARLALAEQSRAAPDDGQRMVLHGLALAYVGRKMEAIREGQRGLELMPISRDGYFGPYVQLQLARVYILVGETDKAIDQLEPLLRVPFYLSPDWLRIDPTFAPLRANPRFQRLEHDSAGRDRVQDPAQPARPS